MEEIKPPTIDDVKAARDAIRLLSKDWTKLVAMEMFGSDVRENIFKVYNITNDNTRSTESRNEFILACAKVKESLKSKQGEVLDAINSLKS